MKKNILLVLVLVLLPTAMIGRFIRPVEAQGTIYIKSDGSVEGTDKIHRDGNVYTFIDNIINQSIIVERNNIVIDGNGYTLQGNASNYESGYGFTLFGINNVTIKNTNIRGFRSGIHINSTSSSMISGNTITDNGFGIMLYNSSDITISGNDITANAWWCIQLKDSSNHNSISGNNLTNTISGSGISIEYSLNNNVSGNIIANNNPGGIWLGMGSSSNIISDNIITTNNQYGIWLYSTSDNNIIRNNITNNGDGIHLSGYSDNVIYHNNFINNTKQFLVYTPGYTNFWDNGAEGNYWSDYEDEYPDAEEIDGSGIWNTPYVIDENNQDNYPLTDVIPEFPTWTSMLLILIVLTIAIAIYKRRLLKTSVC